MNEEQLMNEFNHQIKKKIAVFSLEFKPNEGENHNAAFINVILQTLLNTALEFCAFSGVTFEIWAKCLMAMLDQPHYDNVSKEIQEGIQVMKDELLKKLKEKTD